MRVITWLFVCVCVVGGGSAAAATRTVCASGCQYKELQPAIDAAVPGDTILLRAGETFVGNYILRAKSATSTAFITIKSDAPASSLPAAGVRLIPQGQPGANTGRSALARLVGRGGAYKSVPVIVTAAGAHHYRLQFLEVDGLNNVGYESLISLAAPSQTSLSVMPYQFVIDRVWLHGHPVKGLKRGISMNSKSTDVLNCYFNDFFSFSDSQAIGSWNGAGPYRIINNYMEAAGENIMFGGADPSIPNLVATDIQIRGNHFTKDPAWRGPILKTPAKPSASVSSTAGSLAAGTHYFKVVAVIESGGGIGVSAGSAEVAVTVPGGKAVTLSWPAVAGADSYRVYRGTTSNTQSVYLPTTARSLTYTGVAEKAGKQPRTVGMKWTVKNLLELKNAQRVVVDGNVMEYNWLGFQDGYALQFTPRNQGGNAPWVVLRDVAFTNNIVRHSGAGIRILGRDYNHPSQLTTNIRIANNVFDDISRTWGNTGRFLVITAGAANVVLDHNTIIHTGSVVEIDGLPSPGFQFTNNLVKHNTYGVKGKNYATGLSTLNQFFPGYVFKGNVLAGGKASFYPAGNYFPTVDEFNAMFADLAGGDLRLVASSPYVNKATDGTAVGVDMVDLMAAQGLDVASPAPPTDHRPTADAGGPYTGAVATPVLFDGSGSADVEAPLVSYAWHFGEDIVLRASDIPAANIHGRWKRVSSTGAAAGVALENTNANEAKVATALASPANYVDITFNAASGVPYHVWLRMKATSNSFANDSLYVQFSGAVTSGGAAQYRIGTTGAMPVVLEEGSGASILGWGWNDNKYGGLGTPVYFAVAGPQTIRIQQREDGIQFDQIVISANAFAAKSPGAFVSDTVIVPADLGSDAGITALRAFRKGGIYPISLTVTDTKGQKSSAATSATIR
jgi:hypothetical protein